MSPEVVRTIQIISDDATEAGIVSGRLTREGSVVRDAATGEVVRMLSEAAKKATNEVALPTPTMSKTTSELVRRTSEVVKSNPNEAVVVIAGAAVAVSAVWAVGVISFRRKKRESEKHFEELLTQDRDPAEKEVARNQSEDMGNNVTKEAGQAEGKDRVPISEFDTSESIWVDELRSEPELA